MLKKTSITRLITLSHVPPAKPEPRPRPPPTSIDAPIDTTATEREMRDP